MTQAELVAPINLQILFSNIACLSKVVDHTKDAKSHSNVVWKCTRVNTISACAINACWKTSVGDASTAQGC